MQAVQWLKGRAATGKEWANSPEVWAHETPDNTFELRALLEGLNRIVGDNRGHVVRLLYAQVVCLWSVIAAALLEGGGRFSGAICDTQEFLFVEASLDVPCT